MAKMKWKPTIETCQFVPASQIKKGLDRAWQALIESQPPFTWGDNNRSLVSIDDLRRQMEQLSDDGAGAMSQIKKFIARLDAISDSVPYVDLEN